MAQMIPLTEAALRLRMSWRTALDTALRGDIRAERRRGRWYLDAEDVERVAAERLAADPPQQA